MQVVLMNPDLAGVCISRHAQYNFDVNGVTSCDNVEDILMLVNDNNCKPIQVIDGGDERMNFHIVEFDKVMNQGDDKLLEELKKVYNENWKPFVVKDKTALFYKA